MDLNVTRNLRKDKSMTSGIRATIIRMTLDSGKFVDASVAVYETEDGMKLAKLTRGPESMSKHLVVSMDKRVEDVTTLIAEFKAEF